MLKRFCRKLVFALFGGTACPSQWLPAGIERHSLGSCRRTNKRFVFKAFVWTDRNML
jgi:hypothetical protein